MKSLTKSPVRDFLRLFLLFEAVLLTFTFEYSFSSGGITDPAGVLLLYGADEGGAGFGF